MRLLLWMLACLSATAASTRPEKVNLFWKNFGVSISDDAAAQAEASCDDLSFPAITQPLDKAVLVLGLSGSGKSTLALFLVGSDKLTAVETEEGSDEYIISDGDEQIGDQTISKTKFPNVIPYKAGNLSFVDCPGFADNRGMCVQIRQALAINAVFRQSRKIKVLLTAGYHSLGVESSRLKEFLEFLTQSAKLLKMMDKYAESVGLVLTKVPNDFNRKTKELKTDAEMLKPRMSSLKKLLITLRDNSSEAVAPKLKAGVIRLLEELVVEVGGSFPKVALFRRPLEEGSLKDSKLLMKGFSRMHSMIKNSMKFVSPSPGDFGYTLSPQASLEAGRFLKQTGGKLGAAALGLAKLSVKEAASGITGLSGLEQLQESVRSAKECLAELAAMKLPGEKQAKSCRQVERLGGWVREMERHASTCSQLVDIGGGDLEVDALPAVRPLQDAHWYLGEVEAVLGVAADVAGATQSSRSPLLEQLAKEIREPSLAAAEFQDRVAARERLQRARTRGLDAVLQQLKQQVLARAEEVAADLVKYADAMDTTEKKSEEVIADLRTARDCAETTGAALSQLQVPARCGQGSATQSFHQLRFLAQSMRALVATGHVSSEAAAEGMPGGELGRAQARVAERLAWFSTLWELRRRLGSPEVLGEGAPGRERVEQLFLESVPEEHADTSRALEQRLQSYWSDTSSSAALHTLLQQLQAGNLTTSTEARTLTVSGYVVRISQAMPLLRGADQFQVVAAHSIVLDVDLDMRATRLTLVAPQVVVLGGERWINLDGRNGLDWDGAAAQDQAGSPGRPGQTGGTLLLVAGRVHNAKGLRVSLSGGNGGDGQDGGKGANGKDGTFGEIPSRLVDGKEYLDEKKYCEGGPYYKWGFMNSIIRWCWLNTYTTHENGHNGGAGGAGGLGAPLGLAEVYLTESAHIQYRSSSGRSGSDGQGGKGGVQARQAVRAHQLRAVCPGGPRVRLAAGVARPGPLRHHPGAAARRGDAAARRRGGRHAGRRPGRRQGGRGAAVPVQRGPAAAPAAGRRHEGRQREPDALRGAPLPLRPPALPHRDARAGDPLHRQQGRHRLARHRQRRVQDAGADAAGAEPLHDLGGAGVRRWPSAAQPGEAGLQGGRAPAGAGVVRARVRVPRLAGPQLPGRHVSGRAARRAGPAPRKQLPPPARPARQRRLKPLPFTPSLKQSPANNISNICNSALKALKVS